jgi:hypothetical protein
MRDHRSSDQASPNRIYLVARTRTRGVGRPGALATRPAHGAHPLLHGDAARTQAARSRSPADRTVLAIGVADRIRAITTIVCLSIIIQRVA